MLVYSMALPVVPVGYAILRFGGRQIAGWAGKQLTRFELGRRAAEKLIDKGHGEDTLENRRQFEAYIIQQREAYMNANGTLQGWNPPMWNADP